MCGLRLFFRDHLGRADWRCWAQIQIKRSTSLPTVLSRGEVRVLLASVKEPHFVAVFSLMDDCGLRLGEACRMDFRGCRSLLAQPSANRWHPSGMADTAR